MARTIDADAVLDRYYAESEKQDICDGSQDRGWLMRCIEEAPTLTLPNEPLTLEQLREMDDKPEKWAPCLNCQDIEKLAKHIKCWPSYCPVCGRPLTEQAWADLEKRLRG